MNKIKPSHELKAIAKEKLLGKYKLVIPALLIISLFSLLLNNLSTSIYQADGPIFSFLLYLLFTVISAILLRFFSIGKSFLFLNIMTNREAKLNDIYHGFKLDSKRTIPLCSIFAIVLQLTVVLPSYLFEKYYKLDATISILLLLTLVLLISFILATYFILTYSQIFYLVNDFPMLSAKETFQFSRKIMKGNRGKLLYMYISFIPWILLSFITLGIALFWIIPYINSSLTLFYLNLVESKSK